MYETPFRTSSAKCACVCIDSGVFQVEEHLLLYARIKGVDEERLARVADEKMKQMDLVPFRCVQVLERRHKCFVLMRSC